MPLHDFICANGHIFEGYQPIEALSQFAQCPQCHAEASKVFLRAPLAFVQPDYRYTSPVDGRPITNFHEHIEELARTDTIVYEEGIKQDQERNVKVRDEALERAMDETVEKEIATMPAAKRERLAAELEGGIAADVTRITPPQRSFRE